MKVNLRNLFLVLLFATCFPVAEAVSQTPGFVFDKDASLCSLTKQSDLIVTGKVVSSSWVVDPEKVEAEDKRWRESLGKPDLKNYPKPERFMIGIIYSVDVIDVLYDSEDKSYTTGFSVFVKTNRPFPLLDSNAPFFAGNNEFLFYLNKVKNDTFGENSKLMIPASREMRVPDIVKDETFVLTTNRYSYFAINENNRSLIEDAPKFVGNKNPKCAEQ